MGMPNGNFTANAIWLIPLGDIPEAVAICRFIPAWVTTNGTVTFTNVPVGDYYVALMPTNTELSHERMTECAKTAATVGLRAGEKATVAVKR